ncbi:MAG: response regulator [Deltaproteobacteria bacterium]|nr:response regulator [Deltaproteobacteria bacterium]
MITEKILFVDDDANVLAGYQRQLRKGFHIDTALGGEPGLQAVTQNGPYAVIVSDLRMPGMDGIQFLSRVREIAPDSVRMMLTAFADLQTAIQAVNEGNVFRILTKPCETEILTRALGAGLSQYRLIMAERELLEQTLMGSIKVLIQILSLLNPEAFGRASRITRYAREIAAVLKVPEAWQLETAAMLSQIGCIMLPKTALKKIYHGQPLNPEEMQVFTMHPFIASDLLKNIPRLETVAEIIAYQTKRFDGSGNPQDQRQGKKIPLGGRILKVVLDFDTLKASGLQESAAIMELKKRPGWYDPAVLAALEAVIWIEARYTVREVSIEELVDSMILDDDVWTKTDTLLITKGEEISTLIRRRLKNFAETVGVKEPIRVLVPLHSGN